MGWNNWAIQANVPHILFFFSKLYLQTFPPPKAPPLQRHPLLNGQHKGERRGVTAKLGEDGGVQEGRTVHVF